MLSTSTRLTEVDKSDERTDVRKPEQAGRLASLGNVNSRPRCPGRYVAEHGERAIVGLGHVLS
jgi:hypothetical protein